MSKSFALLQEILQSITIIHGFARKSVVWIFLHDVDCGLGLIFTQVGRLEALSFHELYLEGVLLKTLVAPGLTAQLITPKYFSSTATGGN